MVWYYIIWYHHQLQIKAQNYLFHYHVMIYNIHLYCFKPTHNFYKKPVLRKLELRRVKYQETFRTRGEFLYHTYTKRNKSLKVLLQQNRFMLLSSLFICYKMRKVGLHIKNDNSANILHYNQRLPHPHGEPCFGVVFWVPSGPLRTLVVPCDPLRWLVGP